LYTVQSPMMTEAWINAGFTRVLHVARGEEMENSSWAVRVHVKPFGRGIWVGGMLMGLGRALATLDRRDRVKVNQRSRAAQGLE
ncbi:cytochrome c-type biogenesis CcmF C-terminal domain-containing protein, partial [Pseudomonas aeruginosa]